MNFINLFFIAVYITIVVIWTWARFKFFKIESSASKLSSKLYDPIATLHIVTTVYFASNFNIPILVSKWIGLALYLVGISLFLWVISTARNFHFSFSDEIESLVTTGPYRIVRHPLYASYSIVWLSSSIVFNSIILWITLVYMITFYNLSARKEEIVILNSKYSMQYYEYKKQVGKFFPRITIWTS